jgi:ABC-type nitrate/sulfonate/bicarbonate transport system substrate-binding protein
VRTNLRWKLSALLAAVVAVGTGVFLSPVAQAAPRHGAAAGDNPTFTIVQPPLTTEGDGVFVAFYNQMKKAGLHFKVTTVTTPADLLRVLLAGKAQIAMATPIPSIQAVSQGHAKIKFLAADAASTEYWLLSLPKFNLHNLSGATLGTAGPGSADVVIGLAALGAEHVTTNSLKQVNVGDSSARITALLAGKIDLGNATAPIAEPAVASGKVKLLVNTGQVLKPFLQQGIVATTTWTSKNHSLMQKIVNAMVQSERFDYNTETGYINLVNKNKLRAGLTNAEEKAVYKDLKAGGYFAPNGGVCSKDISHTVRVSVQTKEIAQATTVPMQTWVNQSFVRNFLKAHHQSPSAC